MNDTFTDETQLDIDSSFTDSPPVEEPSTDIVEILPNGDEPVITPPVVQITATPTPAMVTATPTPVPEVTTVPPEQLEASTPPTDAETSLGDSSETETDHTIDDIYTLLSERVKALEEQELKQEETRAEETQALTEYRSYMVEQSKNVLSVSSLIFITLAFLSGLILARIVWRKL